MDYWKEAFMCALEEAGIDFPDDEQLTLGADCLRTSHENYGMAYPTPESPLVGENSILKRELHVERNKVHCEECDGRGSITTPGPYHSSTSRCWQCNGEGKIIP